MKKGIIIIGILLILISNKVNASTFNNGVEVQYYKEESLTTRWTSNNWYDYASLQSSTGLGTYNQVDFYPSPQINIQDIKKGYIEFTYYMSLPIVRQNVNNTFTIEEEECTRWGKTTINNREVWECILWSTNTNTNTITDSEYIHPVVNINAVIIYNNGYADYCSMDTSNQKFVCPISNYASLTSIKFIRFSQNIYYSNSSQYTYQFGIMRRINRYSDSAQDIISNQNNNTQEIINQNATYEDTPSKDLTNETQQMEDYEQAEENLINSLDFNMTMLDGITINPNASTFIWGIVDRLRQINPAIILLMTSILGMGLIKMVLNR